MPAAKGQETKAEGTAKDFKQLKDKVNALESKVAYLTKQSNNKGATEQQAEAPTALLAGDGGVEGEKASSCNNGIGGKVDKTPVEATEVKITKEEYEQLKGAASKVPGMGETMTKQGKEIQTLQKQLKEVVDSLRIPHGWARK